MIEKSFGDLNSAVDKIAQTALRIQAERDELLAAAKDALEALMSCPGCADEIAALEAAIARAEGREP
jgi:hypothetical protein